MNDISMTLFPLEDGTLVNVNHIVYVRAASETTGPWMQLSDSPLYSCGITQKDYDRLKKLYSPTESQIL